MTKRFHRGFNGKYAMRVLLYLLISTFWLGFTISLYYHAKLEIMFVSIFSFTFIFSFLYPWLKGIKGESIFYYTNDEHWVKRNRFLLFTTSKKKLWWGMEIACIIGVILITIFVIDFQTLPKELQYIYFSSVGGGMAGHISGLIRDYRAYKKHFNK